MFVSTSLMVESFTAFVIQKKIQGENVWLDEAEEKGAITKMTRYSIFKHSTAPVPLCADVPCIKDLFTV